MNKLFALALAIIMLSSCDKDITKYSSVNILNENEGLYEIKCYQRDTAFLIFSFADLTKQIKKEVFVYRTDFGNEDNCKIFNTDSCMVYKMSNSLLIIDSVKFKSLDKDASNILSKENYKVEKLYDKHTNKLEALVYSFEISNCFKK